MTNMLRATQGHEVAAVIERAKPKPTRADRKRMVKSTILPPKPKKVKRKKKTTRQKLIKALDTIVREIVFARDAQAVHLVYRDLIDEETGEPINPATMKTDVDHPGHIISRARMSVRWDLRNVHRQNAAHNLLHEFYPEVYNQWFIFNFGLPAWNSLVNDSKTISTYSTAELETLLFNFTELQKMGDVYGYFSQKEVLEGVFLKGTLSHLQERTTV